MCHIFEAKEGREVAGGGIPDGENVVACACLQLKIKHGLIQQGRKDVVRGCIVLSL